MSGKEFPFRSQQAACSSVVYFSNIHTFLMLLRNWELMFSDLRQVL